VVGYVVIVALSVAVGVVVYHLTARMPVREEGPEMWVGAAPAEQAPAPPPSNFERLAISHDRLTWHDRLTGTLGLVVAVAFGAGALAFAIYLAGSTVIALLKQAAASPT
jgi:hypothetical protein